MSMERKREELLEKFSSMTHDERIAFLYIVQQDAFFKDPAALNSVFEWIAAQRANGNNESLVIETANFIRNSLEAKEATT